MSDRKCGLGGCVLAADHEHHPNAAYRSHARTAEEVAQALSAAVNHAAPVAGAKPTPEKVEAAARAYATAAGGEYVSHRFDGKRLDVVATFPLGDLVVDIACVEGDA